MAIDVGPPRPSGRRPVTDHDDPLDNAAWASLTGAHAPLALGGEWARRYPPDVSPFAALHDSADDRAWAQLAEVVDPDETVLVTGAEVRVPDGWVTVRELPGVQLLDEGEVRGRPDPEARAMSVDDAGDVAAMLDLVRRTEPGPLLERTATLGTYLGLHRDHALVALAGERMRPPGHQEISAVCTDPAWTGQGLAARLVRALVAQIHARGEVPLLHTSAGNTRAIGLYEHLGFRLRRRVAFVLVRRAT